MSPGALAKQQGATLAAASPGVNQGSTFTLRFPLAASAVPSAADAHAAPGTGGSARVLVIEDNRDVREMMFLMLSQHGFVVHVAEDGQSGIAAALAIRPDIALVDIDLPDISGYEVAANLRKSADMAALKLVAVTGYGQAMDREKAFAAGFDRHLTKPVPLESLLGAIHHLLGHEAPAA